MTDGYIRRQAQAAHNTPNASCRGKVKFASFTIAKATAAFKARRRKDADHLDPYYCRLCQGWHLSGS